MYCKQCGKEITPESEFCSSCGCNLKIEIKPETTVSKTLISPPKSFELSQLSGLTILYVAVISILALIGTIGFAIISILIGYFLSVYAINNMTWRIKGSIDWAFAIIMSFGIIGYIVYWIYFLLQKGKFPELNP